MTIWFAFAIFLYLVAAALIIAEVFVPSGGIISICSLACVIAGVAIFFNHSTLAGWIGIFTAIIMIPVVVIFAYHIFPKTSFGKAVTLKPTERTPGDALPAGESLQQLLGQTGTVISPLRPVGTVDFDGQRIECVAEAGYVQKEKQVKVIRVQGNTVTVRQTEQS